MKLRYTKTALRQIDDALSYVESHSPHGAAGLRERIHTAIALVQDYPRAGQATNNPGWRRVLLTPFPYVIFYRVVADQIVISRLQHAAKKLLRDQR